jgi:hypothetical protein
MAHSSGDISSSDVSSFEVIPYLLAYKTPLCGPCETNALSRGGYYRKGIYYGRWSVRHRNFAATLCQGGYYIRGGLIAKGDLICQ